jgi:hypothetical protein
MDAKMLFGYVMLYRLQAYLFSVADYEAAELVSEHRYQQFSSVFEIMDLVLAQQLESEINKYCAAAYAAATSHGEWTRLTQAADLRSMMNARYLRSTLQ